MNDFKVSALTNSLIPFPVYKNTTAELLWLNDQLINDNADNKKSFLQSYAYGVKENEFFDEIVFDFEDKRTAYAERYGGWGTHSNDGGSRCGIIEGLQLKGIGKNPLAGKQTDHWHNYGGLNLVDAVFETINSIILNKILPIGTAKIFAIIITGKKTAMMPGLDDKPINDRRGYGAILVREVCTRPAHFCRSFLYGQDKEFSGESTGDVSRVRSAYKNFSILMGNKNQFIKYACNLIDNYANQFAFARAARIYHGALTQSNISLDGKWLDLTASSFVEGGRNPGAGILPPFYDEPEAAVRIIIEFVHSYAKYDKTSINIGALKDFFNSQFNDYFRIHFLYVLGFNYSPLINIHNLDQIEKLTDHYSNILLSAKERTSNRFYALQENDSVLRFIEDIYLCAIQFSVDQTPSVEANLQEYKNFFNFVNDIYYKAEFGNISFRNFVIYIALIALKRTHIQEYFAMGRLEGAIYTAAVASDISSLSEILKNSIQISTWAFDSNEGFDISDMKFTNGNDTVVVFMSEKFKIWFSATEGNYSILNIVSTETRSFNSYQSLLSHIQINNCEISISGYCFEKMLFRQSSVIGQLESTDIDLNLEKSNC